MRFLPQSQVEIIGKKLFSPTVGQVVDRLTQGSLAGSSYYQ